MTNKKYIVTTDCFCEHYLHEKTKYPREGLVELKLYKDDVVLLIRNWQNFYGLYRRVEKDGQIYDIKIDNLKPLREVKIDKLKNLTDG